ncbi:hypothetical protein CV016_18030 [Yersinia kristensenii]|uniref:PIN domain-containing protein n=1 Tax=Yersinia kristensenii TaxID=28152 RepID=UPI000C22B21B|nr:PIN domain-containing protein [Yersinia kristensenii]PJG61399.1 hypothetical protein CV016_18030 [Yersinia kristensenii]
MHKIFRGFYTPKEADLAALWQDEKTIFIFDTNTLFNLYRCEEQTRKDLLSVMNQLSSRSWFPFQVYYEYQRNRKEVISDSLKSLETTKKTLQSISTQTDKALSEGKIKKHLYSSLSEELTILQSALNKPIEEFIKNKIDPRIEQKIKIAGSDFIRLEIDKIIGENCGELPTQELIDKINSDGEKRYAASVPPGFSDAKTKNGTCYFSERTFTDKFGDLYLWMEVLKKAKQSDGHNIFFISDDAKKDWWFMHNGERVGPLESLQTEIYNRSNINSFRMLTQSSFLFEAQKHLSGVTVNQSSVDEVHKFSMIDEDQFYEYEMDEDNFITMTNFNHENRNIKDNTPWYNEFSDEENKEITYSARYNNKKLLDNYRVTVDNFNQSKELLELLLDKATNFYANKRIHTPIKVALKTVLKNANENIDNIQVLIDILHHSLFTGEISEFFLNYKEYNEHIYSHLHLLNKNIKKAESLLN